ncbi:SPOR domain-containing protein [Variovorax sp. J22G73]|uniref:SPOR domain-containing protein n=1 Tax=unclassified Variovorax TaxID=663243 RepID=UPI002575175C|nr:MULTISPECIES: SPOR domain-containing protein [unclassified Variovorax]MDM0009232.1 SPOR domain-containing protein [Variovorax sp. J22R203]MDM0101832.1 SPOR domain-containing protein [Variovorax sp. J22G73]
MKKTTRQRGNIVIGLIIGLVLGLGVALGIAVYVTKVPIPFVTKTQKGGAEQDEAEARKNRDWDPNAPLAGKAGVARPAPAATGPVNPVTGEPATAAVAPGSPPPTTAPPVPVVVAPKPTRAAPVPAEANALPPSNDPLGDLARARSGSVTTASAAPSSSNNSTAAASTSGADPFMYFVQAGAFRTTDDAEAQRAKLSLMGVEAKVTEREQAGRTVYRVRAGPFNKKDDADRLKDRLDGGGMESALVRVQR